MTRSMSSPIRRVSIFRFSVTTAFRSRTLGASICLRLKASSWRVSEVARSAALAISCAGPRDSGSLADALQQELAVAGDHHEQIVEVVGDAAGEPADGFHLLRLAELLLQGAAFGDVFGKEFEEDALFFAAEWRRPERRTLTCLPSLRDPLGHHSLKAAGSAK